MAERWSVVHLAFRLMCLALLVAGVAGARSTSTAAEQPTLRVGAAAVELVADDAMIIGGGIGPGHTAGQEGKLRAVAVVLELPADATFQPPGSAAATGAPQAGPTKLAIVACDVLMLNRDLLDPVVAQIAERHGIPASNVLVNCTHTHHAPSTVTVHGYARDEEFCRRVQQAILGAVTEADQNLIAGCRFDFRLGEESSVGQNSRLLLEDNSIFWIGPHDDAVRPTGPFDPELPVLSFRGPGDRLIALLFNHSTHTIGTRQPGRSPAFYGLAAQELEAELGGVVSFLEGASGSTHNLTLNAAEMVVRIKGAVNSALAQVQPRPVRRLAALKRPFAYRVRKFDEAVEDTAVSVYCRRRAPQGADEIIRVFRQQRETLAPHQGQERSTWVQALVIGDVALVGVPAEFFTVLGQDIKRRSPYRYTFVAELANDWIGYLPDHKAFELGGYQTWTGLHSLAEPGTGERMVEAAVELLEELHAGH